MNNKIIDKCVGCTHMQEDKCDIWICPTAKWKLGVCPSASHVDRGVQKVVNEKVRVGQPKGRRKNRKV